MRMRKSLRIDGSHHAGLKPRSPSRAAARPSASVLKAGAVAAFLLNGLVSLPHGATSAMSPFLSQELTALMSHSAKAAPTEGTFLRSVTLFADGTSTLAPGELRGMAISDLEPRQVGRVLVQFKGEPSRVRHLLEKNGVTVETWLPQNTFLISGRGELLQRLSAQRASFGLSLLEPYHPAWRISPEVLAIQPEDEEARLLIHLFKGTSVERFRQHLQAQGLRVDGISRTGMPRVALRLSGEELVALRDDLARHPDVFWLELRGEARLYNNDAVPLVQSGAPGSSLTMASQGLMGQNQIVGYIDTGLDVDSCYFRDASGKLPTTNVNGATATDPSHRKVVAYDFLWRQDSPSVVTQWDNHGHGTHVGGNIGGDNLANPGTHDSQDGMAPLARLVVQDGGYGTDNCADLPALGCPVVDLKPFFEQAWTQGARIHTDSWGDNENSSAQNNYSAGSQDVDTFMWEHPEFLLLFAAGNSGPASGTIGSPSTAKNSLSIGGNVNGTGYNTISSFSSRGPTTDNRIKPDLLAPANNTSADSDNNITTNNCGTDTGSGTSYASPLAAGAAALVRQYFTDGYYPSGSPSSTQGFVPSAALIKAVLLNSGTALTTMTAFPGYDQGWGRINLSSVLPFANSTSQLLVFDGTQAFSSSSDKAFSWSFQLPDSNTPLKVSLVWTDPASTPASATNLVNDLDLVVQAPKRTLLGNVFRRGESTTGGSADVLNNVEQVLINAPRAGTYTVTVKPNRIVQGPQRFALVIRSGKP